MDKVMKCYKQATSKPITSLDFNLLIDVAEAVSKDLKVDTLSSLFHNKTLPSSYSFVSNLAKGGYGEVTIVRKKDKIHAMKKIPKDLIKRNLNSTFFMTERNILLKGDNNWILRADECIQDDTFIYFLMDYIPGGDLMGYLSRKTALPEDEIKFYAAEIALCINKIHKLGFIHRDIKPDNVLIKKSGHVILADFGSASELKDTKIKRGLPVGTPDYISLEILSEKYEEYDENVDFWSLGVVIYEMVTGETPFYSKSLKETYAKITNLIFPPLSKNTVSSNLIDLISKLITPVENRLNWEGIKNHSFFKGVDWENLLKMTPPFIPTIKDEIDCSNFTETDFISRKSTFLSKGGFKDFIGFTYDPTYVGWLNRNVVINKSINSDDENTKKKLKDEMISLTLTADLMEDGMALKDDIEFTEMAELRLMELEDLNMSIDDLKREKDEIMNALTNATDQLVNVNKDIIYKKDEMTTLDTLYSIKNSQLTQVKEDIERKSKILSINDENMHKKGSIKIKDEIRDIEKRIERANISKSLYNLKELLGAMYMENRSLRKELKSSNSELDTVSNSDEDMRKQLRKYKTEIKDYEQRIEQEVETRGKLEIDISRLKEEINKNKIISVSKKKFQVFDAFTSKKIDLELENSYFKINEVSYISSLIFIRNLRNNEYHHFTDKKRSLSVVIHILNAAIMAERANTTDISRRSPKSIEKELIKEENILKSFNKLILLSCGTMEDLETQIKASENKIAYLNKELEKSKVSSCHSIEEDEDSKCYEYNNHLFYDKTVGKGTLCDYCNGVIYGVYKQSLYCRECHYTVHKSCYLLVEYSCETKIAIDKGITMVVICSNLESKEGILKLSSI